jgi:uncharacterized lipoprotein YajG
LSKDPTLRIGVLLAALTLTGTAGAAPQKVFRCGPDGRTYSQTPCKEGSSVVVDANDKRTAEQRKDAEAAVKREAEMAEKMRRDRLAQEAEAAKQNTRVVAKPVAAEQSASAVAKKKKKPTPKPAQG